MSDTTSLAAPGERPASGERPGPGDDAAAASAPVSVRALAWLLVVCGAVGALAAFTLTVERIELLMNPDYVPTCTLNPVLSCGSVMQSEQARVFGFPNPLIGLAAFPMLLLAGATLLAGARPARWWWAGLQVGATLGLAFVVWLIAESLYEINALCPYCMVVWVVTITVFFQVTRHNVTTGVLGEHLARSRFAVLVRDWSALATLLVLLVVIGLALERFWYYWSTLL